MNIWIFLLNVLLTIPLMALSQNTNLKNVEIENAYKDKSGRMIVRFKYKSTSSPKEEQNPEFFGSNRAFYGTEKKLFQLDERGYGGSTNNYTMGFSDPRIIVNGKEERGQFFAGVSQENIFKENTKYTVICGDKKKSISYQPLSKQEILNLQELIRNGNAPLSGLSKEVRVPEYIFKGDNGTIIYLDAEKYNYSYDSFRMFSGKPGAMKEIKVKSVDRFRDGGTTYIKTEDGSTLYSPTAFNKDESPTWNGAKIERLGKKEFDLASLGIKGVPSIEAKLNTPCDRFFKTKVPGSDDVKPEATKPENSATS